jgi:DNA-directed RNA polymerase specialized sigma24 family protein
MRISAEIEERLRAVAGAACPRPELREEFVQEMLLALLLLPEGHREAWYIVRAKSRALDWIRRQFHLRRRRSPASAGAEGTALTSERRAAAVGWHLLGELDRILDQDPAVLATNLGWE